MINLIIVQILFAIFIENTRRIVVNKNRNNKLALVIVTIVIILIEFNYKEIIMILHYKQKLFRYVCSTIIPIIISNILYTYLATKGFYKFNLVYRIFVSVSMIIIEKFLKFDWFIAGSYKIISSAIIYFIVKYKFVNKRIDLRKKKHNALEKIGCIMTISFSIVLVCFMLGVFKYQSISIMSNSMFPLYKRGDVVVFKKVKNLEKIPKGAILIYTSGKKNIAHRVVDVVKTNKEVAYQTKGDNNKDSDINLVKTNQILGVYIFHIKYIGFPSIWLYEYFNYK